MIPDDLIGRYAPQIIASAHDPSRKIPTFVQQLEYVESDPTDPQKPCAFARYGLTAETMGDEAADYVDKVLRDADQASTLPVKYPSKFEFWINCTVAGQLGIAVPPNVLAQADRTFPPFQPAAAQAVPTRAPAPARTKTTTKPKRRKLAAKRPAARKTRSRKAPARGAKPAASRAKRSARRRPKQK